MAIHPTRMLDHTVDLNNKINPGQVSALGELVRVGSLLSSGQSSGSQPSQITGAPGGSSMACPLAHVPPS
eukprot:720700-Karenia_brevis.AAC.1